MYIEPQTADSYIHSCCEEVETTAINICDRLAQFDFYDNSSFLESIHMAASEAAVTVCERDPYCNNHYIEPYINEALDTFGFDKEQGFRATQYEAWRMAFEDTIIKNLPSIVREAALDDINNDQEYQQTLEENQIKAEDVLQELGTMSSVTLANLAEHFSLDKILDIKKQEIVDERSQVPTP